MLCDSTGIIVLIGARKRALAIDAAIALAAVPERISRIFRIVGLDQVSLTSPLRRPSKLPGNRP
ncbi:STAS domain-containing protein [Streptomyces sp. NPDC057094]|uniref:STAS domain-containing protein n=1 Tax=unclassified Streptomyces TaxID=2593676 RepID=UPI00362C3852